MNIFILAALVVTGQCYINTYDCSTGDREKEGYVDITETDPVDTVLFVFNNSHGDLRWMASLNGTNGDYLSQFFKSLPTEGAEHALKLAKILDLELLQLELVSPGELFTEDRPNTVTLDLTVICSAETREVNEWKFKINIRSVNEFYPQFIGSPFRTAVPESVALGTLVFDIGSKATDLDAGHTNLTFAVAPYMITQFDGSGYVAMNNTNKGTLVLTRALDFESFLSTGRTYMFVNVTATDDGGFTSATSVNVSVTDSNDQSIQMVYPDCAKPCVRPNYTVSINESFVGLLQVQPVAILAEDLDTLNDSVIYSLEDEKDKEFFDIDESTGALYKTAPLVNDSFGYSIEVQVRALESTDEGHFLDFNVTIFIKERLPKPDSTLSPTVAPLRQRSDLECYSDSLAIQLPDGLFPAQRNITWRDDVCSVIHNGSHYISNILLTECGTTVLIENDTVTFSNELIVHKVEGENRVQDNVADRSISYGEDYETVIPVKCIYPRYDNVSTEYIPVKQNVRFYEKRYGELDIAMEQFENDQYDQALDTSSSPRKVPLNDDVFIRVGLNFEPNNIRVNTDQCIATSTPMPADKNWRSLITSGCPEDSVRLLSNENSSDVKFAFRAFDFRHSPSGFIYVHCEVSVCDDVDASCRMGCSARAKRSADSRRQRSHLVSTGPLFIEKKGKESKDMVTMPTVAVAASLLVAMAAVIVAIIGWTRKPRHNGTSI